MNVDAISVLRIEPRDILVISCPGLLPQEAVDRIKERFKEVLPDTPCICLGSGLSLSVVRPAT